MSELTIITGTVSSRSSRRQDGPPGEAEILSLNPQRGKMLCLLMGWDRLEPGSLNIECDESVLERALDDWQEIWLEPPESVVYPEPFTHIPLYRGGYRYFFAKLQAKDRKARVLVRRAVNPLPMRMEVFSDRSLRCALILEDGDEVSIVLDRLPETDSQEEPDGEDEEHA